MARRCFIDDCNVGSAAPISRGEVSSRQNRHAEGSKIARTYRLCVYVLVLIANRRVSLRRETTMAIKSLSEPEPRKADRLHSFDRREPLYQPVAQRDTVSTDQRCIQMGFEGGRIESGIHRSEVPERAQQQAGRNRQNNRKSSLCDNQVPAQPKSVRFSTASKAVSIANLAHWNFGRSRGERDGLCGAVARRFSVNEAKIAFRLFVFWSVRFLVAGGRGGLLDRNYAIRAQDVASGKILRALEQKVKGEAEPEFVPTDDENFINLEHVLPENPEGNWPGFDSSTAEAFYKRLGNLVLLQCKKEYADRKWGVCNQNQNDRRVRIHAHV